LVFRVDRHQRVTQANQLFFGTVPDGEPHNVSAIGFHKRRLVDRERKIEHLENFDGWAALNIGPIGRIGPILRA
jgi:hypothetical protein